MIGWPQLLLTTSQNQQTSRATRPDLPQRKTIPNGMIWKAICWTTDSTSTTHDLDSYDYDDQPTKDHDQNDDDTKDDDDTLLISLNKVIVETPYTVNHSKDTRPKISNQDLSRRSHPKWNAVPSQHRCKSTLHQATRDLSDMHCVIWFASSEFVLRQSRRDRDPSTLTLITSNRFVRWSWPDEWSWTLSWLWHYCDGMIYSRHITSKIISSHSFNCAQRLRHLKRWRFEVAMTCRKQVGARWGPSCWDTKIWVTDNVSRDVMSQIYVTSEQTQTDAHFRVLISSSKSISVTLRRWLRHQIFSRPWHDPIPVLSDLMSCGWHAQIEMCRQVSFLLSGHSVVSIMLVDVRLIGDTSWILLMQRSTWAARHNVCKHVISLIIMSYLCSCLWQYTSVNVCRMELLSQWYIHQYVLLFFCPSENRQMSKSPDLQSTRLQIARPSWVCRQLEYFKLLCTSRNCIIYLAQIGKASLLTPGR